MSILRLLTTADVPGIVSIETECFTDPWSYQSIQDSVCNPRNLYIGVEEEGVLAGFVGLLCVLDEGDIANVAILPLYRGQGLGRKLMERCFEEAAAREIHRIHLEVRESNRPALSLYQSLNFQTISLRKHYYTNPAESAIIMCKELPL